MMSRVTCEWIMSHMWMGNNRHVTCEWVTRLIICDGHILITSLLTCMWYSSPHRHNTTYIYYTYSTYICHIFIATSPHINRHVTCEWVMSHMMSRVTYEWIMSLMCEWVTSHVMSRVTYEWFMSLMWMGAHHLPCACSAWIPFLCCKEPCTFWKKPCIFWKQLYDSEKSCAWRVLFRIIN